MKEELISFDTSKLAKEKGYKITPDFWGDYSFYTSDGFKGKANEQGYYYKYTQHEGDLYPLISQSLLQKWLREIHNIDIEIKITTTGNNIFTGYIGSIINKAVLVAMTKQCKTFEKTLEISLLTGLSLIKNGKDN